MYNHKLRGRPDDPKNKAMAAAKQSLAQTIQVNSLSPSLLKLEDPSDIEIARSRHHYNEFKKHYALKYSSLSLRPPKIKMPIIKETQNIDIYKLDTSTTTSQSLLKIVDSKPFSRRPATSMPQRTQNKHVNVPSWTQDTEAEYNRYTNDVQATLLLEKLKEMEKNASKTSQNSKVSQSSQYSQHSQNAETQIVLEQAEKEASVAQDQLAAIQKLLKVDRATSRPNVSLRTIKENNEDDNEKEETHPKLKQKKLVDDVKEKIAKEKNKNMMMTLSTLNKRIKQMHDKFFNEPKPKYLTLKDVQRRMKIEKHVEVLYKNDGFDPEKEISEILLENKEKEEQTPAERDSFDVIEEELLKHKIKPVNIIRKAVSIPLPKHEFTADISSDNYLQNKKIKNVSFHVSDDDESQSMKLRRTKINPETDSNLVIGEEDVTNDDSWVTSQNTSIKSALNKISHIQSAPSKYSSAKLDVILSPKASGSNTAKSVSTLHSIQDSILRSEFLMKEFDIKPSDLSTGLSNYESSMSISRRSTDSKPSLPSVQEFFSATSRSQTGPAGLQRAYMEDTIRTQLKNSLYDIF